VGLAVAVGTLSLALQTPLMALGTFSLLLVPALSIWAGVGVAAMVSSHRTSSVGQTVLIAGIVIAVFAAYVILLQFRLPAGMPGGGRTIDPSKGGPTVYPPP
jgi:hypothetical protein